MQGNGNAACVKGAEVLLVQELLQFVTAWYISTYIAVRS